MGLSSLQTPFQQREQLVRPPSSWKARLIISSSCRDPRERLLHANSCFPRSRRNCYAESQDTSQNLTHLAATPEPRLQLVRIAVLLQMPAAASASTSPTRNVFSTGQRVKKMGFHGSSKDATVFYDKLCYKQCSVTTSTSSSSSTTTSSTTSSMMTTTSTSSITTTTSSTPTTSYCDGVSPAPTFFLK